jgi:hypothetical protein
MAFCGWLFLLPHQYLSLSLCLNLTSLSLSLTLPTSLEADSYSPYSQTSEKNYEFAKETKKITKTKKKQVFFFFFGGTGA